MMLEGQQRRMTQNKATLLKKSTSVISVSVPKWYNLQIHLVTIKTLTRTKRKWADVMGVQMWGVMRGWGFNQQQILIQESTAHFPFLPKWQSCYSFKHDHSCFKAVIVSDDRTKSQSLPMFDQEVLFKTQNQTWTIVLVKWQSMMFSADWCALKEKMCLATNAGIWTRITL